MIFQLKVKSRFQDLQVLEHQLLVYSFVKQNEYSKAKVALSFWQFEMGRDGVTHPTRRATLLPPPFAFLVKSLDGQHLLKQMLLFRLDVVHENNLVFGEARINPSDGGNNTTKLFLPQSIGS